MIKQIQSPVVLQRAQNALNPELKRQVTAIVTEVKTQGDRALFDLTRQYDGAELSTLRVSQTEINQAAATLSADLRRAIETAAANIKTYHQAQLPRLLRVQTAEGVVCERRPSAIESVGLYVPGGTAPLISTAMMLAIPARLAGCERRVMCTPVSKNGRVDPVLLATAQMCGIDEIYAIGGAQAIAALAYGTETVPRVSKIFGPGNGWVTEAKQQVSQDAQGAAIDMPAGPSELMIIADAQANPQFIAADLLSQAEHGPDSQVFLLTPSQILIDQVAEALTLLSADLPRQGIIAQALKNSALVLVKDLQEAMQIANQYAPEHLILNCDNAEQWAAEVKAAGAVFVGPWAPETVGDYVTGSNHVLPTYGYARNYSGLGVSDFMKFISVQTVSQKGLEKIGPIAATLADLEGLNAHALAVRIRLS